MKKIISAIIIAALCLCMLASCGNGVSVPYYILAMDNYTVNVLDSYEAVKETVTYYENGESVFEYSIYMDRGDVEAGNGYYNVCESFDGYTFYAYDQELYTVTGGKTYSVIYAGAGGYLEYVASYEERAHLLDAGEKYQRYSKVLDEGREVCYYVKVTPLMAADLYHFGITETDKIISKYILDDNDLYLSVEYSVEHKDGTSEKIAERKFEYYETAEQGEAIFAGLNVSEERVSVTIIGENGWTETYKAAKGTYIGIDDGAENRSYYADEAFETAFDFENTVATENMTIFAKNN